MLTGYLKHEKTLNSGKSKEIMENNFNCIENVNNNLFSYVADSKNVFVLHMMHTLIKPTQVFKLQGASKKFTVEDSQNNMIVVISQAYQLQEKLQKIYGDKKQPL